MGGVPDPARLKLARIGLVLEMADGSKVMVYAENLGDATATITTETPEEARPWGYLPRRFGPPETSILIEGIGAYLVQYADAEAKVSVPGRQLEAIRRVIQ